MFANCQAGGMNFGFPDVCLTPIVVPVPIPYPNISMGPMAMPATAALKVLLMGLPAHNLMTMVMLSMGDNAGINLGLLSGLVMGPTRWMMGSFGVLMGGMPATKMTSMTGQNGLSLNAVGISMVPSQFKVLVMR